MHHKHHVIPFHEWKLKINPGATRYDKEFNSSENVVYLTIEQHSQVHQFLFELNGHWQDEFAWKFLSGQHNFTSLNGVLKTEHHKEKIRLASLKRWQSQEERQKQSQRFSGANNPRYGKPGTMLGKIMPQESRKKIREARLKFGPTKVYQWEITKPDGSKETITNLKQYCRERNMNHSGMLQVISGRLKSYKGHLCKRLYNK